MKCVGCRCTDDRACDGGCYWTYPFICSSCWLIHTKVMGQVDNNKEDARARMRETQKKMARPRG
jgi:hypothetical protein